MSAPELAEMRAFFGAVEARRLYFDVGPLHGGRVWDCVVYQPEAEGFARGEGATPEAAILACWAEWRRDAREQAAAR